MSKEKEAEKSPFVEALVKTAPVLALFIINTAVIGVLNPDDVWIVISVGLLLAFTSLIAVLIAILLIKGLKLKVKPRATIEASTAIVGTFFLSDATLLAVPENFRSFLVILGMILGCIAFIAILSTGIVIGLLEIRERAADELVSLTGNDEPKKRETRWLEEI